MSIKQLKKKPLRKKATKKDKDRYYVNGNEFKAAIQEFYDSGDVPIPGSLAIYVKKIADGLSFAPNFINYSYKEDMVGDAIVKMLSALMNKKYDPSTGSNPFSYFTTIAFHAFINRIKKEKKHRDMISDYQEAVYDELMGTDIGARAAGRASTTNSDDIE
jgi:hypothetical protein|tara:strand:+ start:3475 stop:3954 length:480 start_codon:yes stop_codon:yes gene_type:complete